MEKLCSQAVKGIKYNFLMLQKIQSNLLQGKPVQLAPQKSVILICKIIIIIIIKTICNVHIVM